ncbi:MAG: hypothetical protein ACI9MR_004399 [Myxococcota bacterium]|jgi:hypothetical protein
MGLSQGTDYVFFPKIQISKQSLGATMTDGLAVCTAEHIFVIPQRSTGIALGASLLTGKSKARISTYGVGEDAAQWLPAMLADPEMDRAGLEETLSELLTTDKTRWHFPLKQAEKFKMTAGLMGQTTLKYPMESVRRLVFRGKGAKKEAKAFYDAQNG